jgi:hypothetical protein
MPKASYNPPSKHVSQRINIRIVKLFGSLLLLVKKVNHIVCTFTGGLGPVTFGSSFELFKIFTTSCISGHIL